MLTYTEREARRATEADAARAEDPVFEHEPLATLGDSLALLRWRSRVGRAADGSRILGDLGASEGDSIVLVEVDARGAAPRTEIFAADRLGDAVARLYERYAELLPDGPERARAAATARSVAALLGPFDLDRYATALAPDIEFVDHRIVGMESVRGAEAYLRRMRALLEVADDIAARVDEVLGLRRRAARPVDDLRHGARRRRRLREAVPPALRLRRRRPADARGVVRRRARGRGARALRRADGRAAEVPARRVRANAATANAARVDAAVAARDLDAFLAQLAEDADAVDHPTGATYAERDVAARRTS